MKKMKKWLPAVVIMLVIFILSSVQGSVIDSVGLGKESYHINAHFFLFVLLCVAYYHATGQVFLSIVLTITFGIFDELHQLFTPYRSSSFFDIQVDSFGALIGGLAAWKSLPAIKKKLKNLLRK